MLMKKLLYIAFNNRENTLYGVRAKILSQCRAFSEWGYQVDLIERCGPETVVLMENSETVTVKERKAFVRNYYVRSVLDKQYQMLDIKAYVKDKQYDACYIRYDFSDFGFLSLLKQLRTICGKIVLELPTYPYDDENKKSFLSRLKLAVDIYYRKQLHKYVDCISTFYGGNETIFGIPAIVIPNGFDFSTMNLVHEELPTEAVHIIAVSSMREWHGYERFLEGMRNYYQQGSKRKIILHLVGKGREYSKYESLTKEFYLDPYVVFHGALHGEMLDAVYERCAIGIDSLARHRSGIHTLSSLKSREYGAKGIPMINSCKIDILEDDFLYLLRVPADESPIDMDQVLAFHDRCYGNDCTRVQVGKEIRSYIEARSSMKETLRKVVEALNER